MSGVAPPRLRFDPNVRVLGNQTRVGFEDLLDGDTIPRPAQTVRLVETESGLWVDGIVTAVYTDKRLIVVAVDWSRVRVPEPLDDVLVDADAVDVAARAMDEAVTEFVTQRADGGFDAEPREAARLAVEALRAAGHLTSRHDKAIDRRARAAGWKPGDPVYPFVPDYEVCADESCGAMMSGPGELPKVCAECGGPTIGAEVEIGWAEVGPHADPDLVPADELTELLYAALERQGTYRRDQLHHVSRLPYTSPDGERGAQMIAWVTR